MTAGRLPAEHLPPAARRAIAIASDRAGDVEALLNEAVEALAGEESEIEDLSPRAANWRGRLEGLRADLAAPLCRLLGKLCDEARQEKAAARRRNGGPPVAEAGGPPG